MMPSAEGVLAPSRSPRPAALAPDATRLRRAFDADFAFTWRYLRRLGLREADADDAAQQAFVILSRRLDDVEPGRERAFLCGTAIRLGHMGVTAEPRCILHTLYAIESVLAKMGRRVTPGIAVNRAEQVYAETREPLKVAAS